MEFSQMRERLDTRPTTPDDDVFSTPGSSFFGQAFFSSSPQIDSTPPTSDFAGSSHNTPVNSHHRTPVKSLNTPWGIGLEEQDIKFETTPPPSSQLPAEYDLSPTPAPKNRRATPNAVRPQQCCQINIKLARGLIDQSKQGLPLLSTTSDEHTYNRWATIVRNALSEGNMWKFVDGSHADVHRNTHFYRRAESKTADLIRDAYTAAADCPAPAILDKTWHMPAEALWDHIRAAHTSIPMATPTPSFFSTINTLSSSNAAASSSTSPLPSAAPQSTLPPSDHFSTTSGRVYFLVQLLHSCTQASHDGDAARFAAQLETIEYRMAEFGYRLPAYMLNMHFLFNLEPEFGPKVKELQETYGEALWKGGEGDRGGGVSFAVVREAVIEEEARLREELEEEKKDKAVREVLEGLGEDEGDDRRTGKEKEREWWEEWIEEDIGVAREERRKRADAAERRMRLVDDDLESSTSIADEELKRLQEDIQESSESDEADASEKEEEEHESSGEEEQELPAESILQAKETSEEEAEEEYEEQVQGRQPRGILQVKDTEDEESEESSSEEEPGVEPSVWGKRPTTPEQVQSLNGMLRVSETPLVRPCTQPQPSSSNVTSSQSALLAKSPARVAQILGDSARRISAVPVPSTCSAKPPPATGPSSSAPSAASVRATASSTYVLPPDPNEPYSDPEGTAAAVRRARGTKNAAKLNKKQRRDVAKTNKKQKKREKKLHEAVTADSILARASRKRKTVAEANEAFDREYKKTSSLRAYCYRCKQTDHGSECKCPWSPSVARDTGTGRLVNVGFTRLPHIDFKVERKEKKEGEKSEGKGEDKEKKKKKKSKKDKKERKEQKRKQREEDEREEAAVGSPSKTARRSSLAL